MTALLRDRLTLVYFFLVGATAVSWAMGHGMGFSDLGYANSVIILVAFIKIRYVFLEFMEVREAPTWLRGMAECWVIGVCVALMALCWLGADPEHLAQWPRIQGL